MLGAINKLCNAFGVGGSVFYHIALHRVREWDQPKRYIIFLDFSTCFLNLILILIT